MDYANKMSTLQERAIIQLAVNLCQSNSFKEVALCLAKPTYGYFCNNLFYVRDPALEEYYSIWVAKRRAVPSDESNSSLHIYVRNLNNAVRDLKNAARDLKDAALEKECQKLTEELPHLLRDRVRTWMKRIAVEYQSYRCRLELQFGVSRYFLMTLLSIEDWKETGRLDERKLALRLLEDERLTVFQKYQIACVYCLHVHIPELWKRLNKEEISSIKESLKPLRHTIRSGELMPYTDYKSHTSVLLWSYQMEGNQRNKLTERNLWTSAAKQATYYGNRAALMLCWEMLSEQTRHQIVVDIALISFGECLNMYEELHWGTIERLETISWSNRKFDKNIFGLRSHHGDLMLFFLSQMVEEQKLTFFKRIFSKPNLYLDFFLDWPLQHELLRMINRFREIIPKDIHRQCILSLAEKCSKNPTKENHIDEYRSLFFKLWETTPEEMKQYAFNSKKDTFHLLYFLLERSPFLKEDEALFNRVFSDLSQEGRREMMFSRHGEEIIWRLLEQGKWPLLNWFLEECLSKEEISSLKKKFIKSQLAWYWCLENLAECRESLMEDVIDWCFQFDSEKSEFKNELMCKRNLLVHSEFFYPLLTKREFAKVDRMINFCASSDEMKEEIKANCVLCICKELFAKEPGLSALDLMDGFLPWCSSSNDKIRGIKKCLFYQEEIYFDAHYEIAFLGNCREDLERFYKWFDLSPEEIEDHKHIIFNDRYLSNIRRDFFYDAYRLVEPLLWFLTDEEKVIRFIRTFKRTLEGAHDLSENSKDMLDCLESELLGALREIEYDEESDSKEFLDYLEIEFLRASKRIRRN